MNHAPKLDVIAGMLFLSCSCDGRIILRPASGVTLDELAQAADEHIRKAEA